MEERKERSLGILLFIGIIIVLDSIYFIYLGYSFLYVDGYLQSFLSYSPSSLIMWIDVILTVPSLLFPLGLWRGKIGHGSMQSCYYPGQPLEQLPTLWWLEKKYSAICFLCYIRFFSCIFSCLRWKTISYSNNLNIVLNTGMGFIRYILRLSNWKTVKTNESIFLVKENLKVVFQALFRMDFLLK